MVKKITSLDDAPVDIVEAVKRGFIHRGLIPRKYRRHSQLSDTEPKSQPQTARAKAGDSKKN
ncbi:hypothetical protein KW794_03595, partial [Candidatus Saccharibacteria bacterium]|nr:hypothetical protein [Candidatus Saccharibacteria bacterium]